MKVLENSVPCTMTPKASRFHNFIQTVKHQAKTDQSGKEGHFMLLNGKTKLENITE